MLKCGRFNLQVVWGLYANAKNSLYIVHREINPSKKKYHRHSIKRILCKTKDRGLQKLCSKYNKIPFYYYLFLFKTRFFELKSIATLNWSYFKAKVRSLRIRWAISICCSRYRAEAGNIIVVREKVVHHQSYPINIVV